jgi:hypothetical protein
MIYAEIVATHGLRKAAFKNHLPFKNQTNDFLNQVNN